MEPLGEEAAAARRAQDDRLWQHGVHEDGMLFQRGNLFLLAQSLQVVAYATVMSASMGGGPSSHPSLTAARVIAGFGIVLTLSWLYVGHRHFRYSKAVQRRIEDRLPDYRETRAASRAPGLSSMPIIVYALPVLAAIMWLILLFL
ncbi:RipA family octameric membrane protein [Streptomyces sp. NPDC002172]